MKTLKQIREHEYALINFCHSELADRSSLYGAKRENSIIIAAMNERHRAGWFALTELYKLPSANITELLKRAGEFTGQTVFYNADGRMCKEYAEMNNGVTICRYRTIK